jgi:hypothetical protein
MRNALGKPKVPNLPNTLLQEHIRWLEITVNDVFFRQILTPLRKLICDDSPFDAVIILGIFFQISTLAILSDEVAVIGSVEDIFECDYMGVFEGLVDIYFVVEEVDISHVHVLQLDDLDGEALALVIVADAAVDTTAETASNEVLQVEAVPADALLSLGR